MTSPTAVAPPTVAAPPGVADVPQRRFAHLRSLDGLRGLAVVLVVLSHFLPDDVPGGFLGVDLFFVLSGFLITSLLVGEWGTSGSIDLGNFWVRRARRLLPALLVVLVACGVVGVLTLDRAGMHQLGLDGLASLFYVANWRFIFSGQSYVMQFIESGVSPLRHMWSLAIEEQFYLVWPLVAVASGVLARRLAGGRRTVANASVANTSDATRTGTARTQDAQRYVLAAVCGVLAVASAGWMVWLAFSGADPDRIYYGTDSRVFMILAGALVGALSAGTPVVAGRWRRPVIAAGALAVIGLLVASAMVTTSAMWLYQGGYAVGAVALVALLVAAAQPAPNPVARVLSTRPLVGLGLISYGVYLWHWPISVWLTPEATGLDGAVLFVVRSALTLALSLASYVVVEQPIRHRGLAVFGRARLLAAPAVVAGVTVAFLLPVFAFPAIPEAPEGPAPAAGAAAVTAEYAVAPRCDLAVDDSGDGSDRDDGLDGLRVQIIGNSLTTEIRPCLGEVLDQRGVDLVSVDAPGFLLCDEAERIEEQATARATRPDVAVLFVFAAYDDRCGSPWHATIDRLVATWLANGTEVLLVPTVPAPQGGRTEFNDGARLELEHYQTLAAANPGRVAVGDAGRYIRDPDGTYLWRMPCVDPGEPGCRDDGTVGVRFVDGIHFCTNPGYATEGCIDPADAAGERRVTAAVAEVALARLREIRSNSP